MVIRLIQLVFILVSIAPVYGQIINSDNELQVHVSRIEKQLGQYFRATLRYRGQKHLDNINLQLWRQNFSIIHEDAYKDEDKQGRTIQVLKLRLYPRATGKISLSSLKLGIAKSQPININTLQSIVNNSPIKLKWEISSLAPWQREAVIIRVHLQSKDTSSHVILDSSENKNTLLRALKTERRVLNNGDIIFDAGWILYPVNEGVQTIDFPAIRYQLSGSDRRRFYIPLQRLDVKPLPTYLPPNLPIGKFNLNSQIEYADKNQWKIDVETSALIPYGVPGLDKQIAAINDHDISNVKINYSQSSSYGEYGDRSVIYSPLPEWLMPFGKNIILKLRFFNPETGKLDEVIHNLPRSWSMPKWAWWITIIFSLLISVILIRKVKPWTFNLAKRLKLRQQSQNAESPQQLRSLILENGQYITLSEWAKEDPSRKPFVNKLNNICFADSIQADLQLLKSELLGLF